MTANVHQLPTASPKRESREIDVAFKEAETFNMRTAPRLCLRFAILEAGETGKEIEALFCLDANRTRWRYHKTRKQKLPDIRRLYAGKKSRIVRALGWAIPDYRGQMPLPIDKLKGRALRVRTRWVTTDANKDPLPPQQHYEVVDAILG